MANAKPNLDRLFKALADPTRRSVLDRLAKGPATVGDLAAPHDMALPSFTKHITVLENAGLIRTRKDGRARVCEAVPGAYGPIRNWLAGHKVERKVTRKAPKVDRLAAVAQSLYAKS